MNEILDLVQAVFLWVVVGVAIVLALVAWALCRGAAIADRQLADPIPDDVEDVARDTGVMRDLTYAHDLDEARANLPLHCPDFVPDDWSAAS